MLGCLRWPGERFFSKVVRYSARVSLARHACRDMYCACTSHTDTMPKCLYQNSIDFFKREGLYITGLSILHSRDVRGHELWVHPFGMAHRVSRRRVPRRRPQARGRVALNSFGRVMRGWGGNPVRHGGSFRERTGSAALPLLRLVRGRGRPEARARVRRAARALGRGHARVRPRGAGED